MDHSFNRQSPASGEPTDEQLMERIRQREETALAALLKRHHTLFRTIIGRSICNHHDIDDVVQECLHDVWRNAANYCTEKGQALGWILTVVRRRTIDRIRRMTVYVRARDRYLEEIAKYGDTGRAGADEQAAESDRAAVISGLIAKLPDAQQQIVHLAFYRGMSQREIAAATGIPLGTIKTRIELASRKLRSAVLAFGELRPASRAAAGAAVGNSRHHHRHPRKHRVSLTSTRPHGTRHGDVEGGIGVRGKKFVRDVQSGTSGISVGCDNRGKAQNNNPTS